MALSPRVRRQGYGAQRGRPGDTWRGFEQRRHRMKPPELFVAKTEKYGELAGSADSELQDAEKRLLGVHPSWKGLNVTVQEPEDEVEESDEAERSPANLDLGRRKAEFFDRCLRADRSVEYPRHQLPPIKAQEARVPDPPVRLPTSDSQEAPKRNSSIRSREEAQVKLSRLDTSILELVNQCRHARLHPATTGLVRADEEKLKLEYGFLSDERAAAITDTLKVTSSEVREALFRSNGLTALGAKKLLEALPEQLESLDLSQNDLSGSTGWCPAFGRLRKLRSLTLSDCQLQDSTCVELLNNLVRCKSLVRMDLSRNSISNGSAFQPLLKRFALEELDVHWNHLGGEAAALLQGIDGNSELRSLNLSWNPLGKFNAEENCQQLVRLFEETKLRHLDLSRCDLTAAHCRILAEGLRANESIVGLHVSGNEAHVDAEGFLVPRVPEAQAGEDQRWEPVSMAEDEDSCCWVCQNWRETRLAYTPGISGPDANELWVFTSIDGFRRAVPMQREGQDFAGYVMAAPGPLRFVFQADQEILCSRTAPQVEVREMIAAIRGGLGCYKRTNLMPVEQEDGVVLKLLAHSEDEVPRLVEVSHFSTVMVVERPPDEPVCRCYIPRKPHFSPGERQEWSLELSLFAPHWEPLSGKQFRERCFELDWQNSKLLHLLPEEAERMAIRDVLREHYAEMKVLYSSLCSVDWKALQEGKPLAFGMGLYEYTHMLVQHNLVGQDLTLDEADAIFLGSAMVKEGAKVLEAFNTQGRMIHRHGFFGLLVRLALCFSRGNELRGLKAETGQVKKALQYLFSKHLMYPYAPMKNNLRCVQWRETVLHTEVVEGIFRKHMKAVVDPLFSSFSQEKSYLRPEDWFRMLDTMEVLLCTGTEAQMNAWDRVWPWQAAAMSQIDELQSPRTLQLVFVEFLEALARLAGLLHSRRASENQIEDEQGEHWDYGMGVASPVSIFCLAAEVNDKDDFAQLLDTFLTGPVAKALA